MKKSLIISLSVVLLAAPWAGVWYKSKNSNLSLYCLIPYTLASDKNDNDMQLKASIKVHYYPSGSGIGLLGGNMKFTPKEGAGTQQYTVNRNSAFTYTLNNGYVVAKTYNIHAQYGEDVPKTLSDQYLFPSFKDNASDYYQLQKMANGDMMISVGNMPRLYCQSAE
jgi:hypothetical protein